MSLTAERLDRIQPSLTIAISTVVRRMIAEGKNVISLSQGEPDFVFPPVGWCSASLLRLLVPGKQARVRWLQHWKPATCRTG
jgi:hypothetical protein